MVLVQEDNPIRSIPFRHSITEILNHSALALMISIGHRTGLFDTMKKMTPATAREIAWEAALDVRCVREWLGVMAVGGIVEYDPDGQRYYLPSEHAALLSRLTQDCNLAILTQWIAATCAAEDDLVNCFTLRSPMPPARFQRLYEVIAEENVQTIITTIFEQILPLVPELLSKLGRGLNALAIGAGDGHVIIQLAKAFPSSRFAVFDQSQENIASMRDRVRRSGLDNVTFNVCDLSGVAIATPRASYDLILAFDTMKEQTCPARALAWMRKALTPDGFLLIKDASQSGHLEEDGPAAGHALGPFFYARSSMLRMMAAPRSNGRERTEAWGCDQAAALLRAAGFGRVEAIEIPRDPQHHYILALPTAEQMEIAA